MRHRTRIALAYLITSALGCEKPTPVVASAVATSTASSASPMPVANPAPSTATSATPEAKWHEGQLISLETGDREATFLNMVQSNDGRLLGVTNSHETRVELVAISPNEVATPVLTLQGGTTPLTPGNPARSTGTLTGVTAEGDLWLAGSFLQTLDSNDVRLSTDRGESGFVLRTSPRGEIRQAFAAFRDVKVALPAPDGGVFVFGYPHAAPKGIETGDHSVLSAARYDTRGVAQWSLKWLGTGFLLHAVKVLQDGNILLTAAVYERSQYKGISIDRRSGVAQFAFWISPAGEVLHSLLFRGNLVTTRAIVETADTLYLAGFFRGPVHFDTHLAKSVSPDNDAFVLALDPTTRKSRWIRTWGGVHSDAVTSAIPDGQGLRVFGHYNTIDGPIDLDPGPGIVLRSNVADGEVFDLTLAPDGSTRSLMTHFFSAARTPITETGIWTALTLRDGGTALGGSIGRGRAAPFLAIVR